MLNKNKGNAAKHNYVNLYKVGLTALGVALDLKNCTRPRWQKHPWKGSFNKRSADKRGYQMLNLTSTKH